MRITKHAYLIIAHHEYPILQILLSMLDEGDNDVYLHVDKRSKSLRQKLDAFKMQKARLFVLEQPIKVYWGDISQVKVEYLLFETALANGPYAYYHLLSGTDLPIQRQAYIHDFCRQHAGKEFVGFWLSASHQRDLNRKVHRYYLFTQHLKDRHTNRFIHSLTSFCRNMVLIVQKATRYRKPSDLEFRKGPNWVSITNDFCVYLIEHKESVLKHFRFTLCADEIFLQSVLWNSPFRGNIYNLEDTNKGSMRMIDWERGNPYVWRNEDFDELVQSDKLFARKFNSDQIELAQRLMKTYKQTKYHESNAINKYHHDFI